MPLVHAPPARRRSAGAGLAPPVGTTPAAAVLALQRSHGNRAVSAWVARKVKTAKGLDYAKAERANRRWAASLGWGARLAEVEPEWEALWRAEDHTAFADVVAAFQREAGLGADGELGPATWNRLRPVGEVIAEVRRTEAYELCYRFADERLETGWRRATGGRLVGKEQRQTYEWILASRADKMADVPEDYRGTGAPGALVYLGKGEFVKDVWTDLRPGAALQVWRSEDAVPALRKADGTQADFYGTSAIFLAYTDDGEAMKVLHWDQVETWGKDRWKTWIGANPRRPVP